MLFHLHWDCFNIVKVKMFISNGIMLFYYLEALTVNVSVSLVVSSVHFILLMVMLKTIESNFSAGAQVKLAYTLVKLQVNCRTTHTEELSFTLTPTVSWAEHVFYIAKIPTHFLHRKDPLLPTGQDGTFQPNNTYNNIFLWHHKKKGNIFSQIIYTHSVWNFFFLPWKTL